MKKNIASVVKDGLCLGCGVCQDACNKGCIRIEHGKDLNTPKVDEKSCMECGLCLKVCSGKGFEIGRVSSELFEGDIFDDKIGYYHRCYTGHSARQEWRYHAPSGGCLTTFLIYLLRHRVIDGAAVVGFQEDQPMRPYPVIARTPKELYCCRGSKYCVVSVEGICKEIVEKGGKYVVVGLPCHIQSYRNFAAINKRFRESVIGYFAIYCSSNKTMRSQKYLMDKYQVDAKSVKYFSYRDEGCLGMMNFRNEYLTPLKRVPYGEYWMGMRGFFNVPRCSLCIDHYGELADVSFGDMHVGEYAKDHVGVNSIISRSEYWSSKLGEAAKNGWLKLKQVSAADINSSQVYAMRQKKGPGVAAAFRLRKMMGRPCPEYDVPFLAEASMKSVVKDAVKGVMRWMGRHEFCWPVIKRLHRTGPHHVADGEIEFETDSMGRNYISVPAINNLQPLIQNFRKITASEEGKKEVYEKFCVYLKWVEAYCDDSLNGRVFQNTHLVPHLFDPESEWDETKIKYAMQAILQYVKVLEKELLIEDADEYQELILTCVHDFEEVIILNELCVKKSMKNLIPLHWARTCIDTNDMLNACRQQVFVEGGVKNHGLDYRYIRPNSVATIRFLIERVGKDLLGYEKIVDGNGIFQKQFTQVTWNYLQQAPRAIQDSVHINGELSVIAELNKWANGFVHNGLIQPIYLQFYALDIMMKLMKPTSGKIKTVNGEVSAKLNLPNIQIENYAALKADFEKYVQSTAGTSTKVYTVKWLDVSDVKSYILS